MSSSLGKKRVDFKLLKVKHSVFYWECYLHSQVLSVELQDEDFLLF